VEALGKPTIVINDLDIAIELLEKRSAIYSSRSAKQYLFRSSRMAQLTEQ
jgi:SpoU rRNA methylase family enzyme